LPAQHGEDEGGRRHEDQALTSQKPIEKKKARAGVKKWLAASLHVGRPRAAVPRRDRSVRPAGPPSGWRHS
jgi:hypothetical protein